MNLINNIAKNTQKIGLKGLYELLALLALLVAAFFLGKLSATAQTGNKTPNLPLVCQNEVINQKTTQVIASVNGSTYYALWCGGANRIKQENKRFFNTPQQAKKAGYRPAKNCANLI